MDRCNGEQLVRLLEEDAPFHIVRKIPDVELSVSLSLEFDNPATSAVEKKEFCYFQVLHVGCMSRHGPSGIDDKRHLQLFVEIVKYLLNVSTTLQSVMNAKLSKQRVLTLS